MDDGSINPVPSKEEELADEAFSSVFPNGLPPKGRPSSATAIVRSYPLGQEHLIQYAAHQESGDTLGVQPSQLARISRTHHRLAQLLANGMDPGKAGIICNYGAATVSILQSDPAFQELLAFYSDQVDDAFRTVVEEMADLHTDVVLEIRERLAVAPANFTASQLTDLMKALSDRTGNGPTSNVNSKQVSVVLSAADVAAIKAGGPVGLPPDGRQTIQLTPADFRALESNADPDASLRDSSPDGREGVSQNQGLPVRTEGHPGADEDLAEAPLPPVGGV